MENKEKKGINRRDFLKGAVLAGGATALVGITAGCSPSSSGSQSSKGGSSSSADVQHTWDVKPDPITDIAETRDFDIVIVGAGIAGLSAAEAAARNGAKVAVLEKQSNFSIRGVDNGHIGSQWQIKNNAKIPTPERASMLLHLWSQQTTNYNLIHTWASRSGKVFDHIQEITTKHGFDMVSAISPTAKYEWDTLPDRWVVYPDAVSFVAKDDIGMNTADGQMVNVHLGTTLFDEAESNGAEFFYDNYAQQLVGDASSGITGVITKLKDGSYIKYNASKGVIMATGDIGGNQEMIDCWAPIVNRADGNVYNPAGANLGEGLLMGMWAGAAKSKSPAAPMVHQFTLDSMDFNLTSFVMCWLAVNRNGDRYGAE
ncbi:MAG: FAD-dependent oxidoreductase, partial [Coriobacteriales bacterium]|nr:FAD-dependent oxidoreductase [Coriobacteriales bacterium]